MFKLAFHSFSDCFPNITAAIHRWKIGRTNRTWILKSRISAPRTPAASLVLDWVAGQVSRRLRPLDSFIWPPPYVSPLIGPIIRSKYGNVPHLLRQPNSILWNTNRETISWSGSTSLRWHLDLQNTKRQKAKYRCEPGSNYLAMGSLLMWRVDLQIGCSEHPPDLHAAIITASAKQKCDYFAKMKYLVQRTKNLFKPSTSFLPSSSFETKKSSWS